MPLKIAVIVGSLRQDSYNRRLAEALVKLPQANDHAFTFADIAALPHYDQDHDGNQADSVKALKALIGGSDGVLFVTPEYNRSIPGVLKNALDNGSRPYGQSCWAGKPAGVIGVSIGAAGTAMAQQHLRNVLAYLDMPTLTQPEVFLKWSDELVTADGTVGEKSAEFLGGWLAAFLNLVAIHRA
ncbi:NADPH-dependent FMN reductase [Novosphingobium sp. Rr 2-17]|uniref:NADPH-dependent FMN reductase n=1 Tax=Novosphingobium sp. Rr 2-17 TaxID=555793 RepID=UPI0002698556|nr:NAD(P)H-dependent oxidoreductase [Novosphingobium sp. Rr 2-17]EIZ78279.1 NADPH-dependent FMN reductase [Novosphingobium sp. Rr 2-17]